MDVTKDVANTSWLTLCVSLEKMVCCEEVDEWKDF